MRCSKPFRIFKNLDLNKYPDGLEVPCGRCLNCRIHKRKEWTLRLSHELGNHHDAVFVTLTYNSDYLPENSSLIKADLQKYFKRLRKHIESKSLFDQLDFFLKTDSFDHKIKYFACGEYGEESERPHYHAIIYGLSPKDKMLLEQKWPFGFVSIGLAEKDSINYVAGYIHSKLSGDMAEEEYFEKGREPVFHISSKGLGLNFALENQKQFKENKMVTLWGVKHSLPRYYVQKLNIDTDSINKKAVEKDISTTEKYTGVSCTSDQYYRTQNAVDVIKYEEAKKRGREQSEKNARARIGLNRKKL